MRVSEDCGEPMRIPNFLVVGAAKTATSWLHLCLQEHPDVYVPSCKEVDYFSSHYDRGEVWYRSYFKGHDDERAVGELSPSYMFTPEAPARIHQWNPEMTLIFSFRDPVERAYSHYCMLLRGGQVSEDPDRELRKGTRLVEEGRYNYHLRKYLNVFGPENINCLVYEDMKESPELFVSKVFSILGVDETFEPDAVRERFHVRKTQPRFRWLHDGVVKISNWIARLGSFGPEVVRQLRRSRASKIFNWINNGSDFPTMSSTKKRELALYYQEDVKRLSNFLDRDLTSEWLACYL